MTLDSLFPNVFDEKAEKVGLTAVVDQAEGRQPVLKSDALELRPMEIYAFRLTPTGVTRRKRSVETGWDKVSHEMKGNRRDFSMTTGFFLFLNGFLSFFAIIMLLLFIVQYFVSKETILKHRSNLRNLVCKGK